jgi:dTDP-4-amino-4,6-dideoxygalactose transaminase
VRRLSNLGQARKGEHIEPGWNERLDGLQAGVLRVKLPHLPRWNEARRRHAAVYRQLLPELAQPLVEDPGSYGVYHLFPVRIPDRDAVAAELKRHGVEVGIHYSRAVQAHRAWKGRPPRRGSVDNANRWAAEELSLPMHPELHDEEIDRVVETLTAALAG